MELGWFIFGFVMGLVLGGVSISFWHDVKKPYGVLRIDHSDPTKDIYRFELSDLKDVTCPGQTSMKCLLLHSKKAEQFQNEQDLCVSSVMCQIQEFLCP